MTAISTLNNSKVPITNEVTMSQIGYYNITLPSYDVFLISISNNNAAGAVYIAKGAAASSAFVFGDIITSGYFAIENLSGLTIRISCNAQDSKATIIKIG